MLSKICTLSALSILLLSGCLPLTFTNDGAIDFNAHQSIHVILTDLNSGVSFSGNQRSALLQNFIAELREHSGFTTVSDTSFGVDAELLLDFSTIEEETCTTEVDENDNSTTECEYEYIAHMEFLLQGLNGTYIDKGSLKGESSEDAIDAVRKGLDEVVVYFLAPYRI